MNLAAILIIGSVIAGLVSIPFLSSNLDDLKPTGKALLSLNETEVDKIPTKSSKIFTSEKFERIFETAFGKVIFKASSDEFIQQLNKPDRTVICTQTSEMTKWELITKEYKIEVVQTSEKITEICTTPDGVIEKTKEMGEIEEIFEGFNSDLVLSICSGAKIELEKEMEIMEQIKEETIIPGIEQTTSSGSSASVKITGIDKNEEWIEIENQGDIVSMDSWTLSDIGNHIYTFSEFGLDAEAKVKIYTGDAYSTCVEDSETLCWSGTKIWNDSGDTATLKNENGNVVDTFSY